MEISKYILITFYEDTYDTGEKVWRVYGHIYNGRNESLGMFRSKEEALDCCFNQTGVPVMQGLNYGNVLDKLQASSPELPC